MRCCIECKITKPLDEFHFARKAKNIRHKVCRLCKNNHTRRYWLEKREEYKVTSRKYYRNNREKCITRHKLWEDNHRTELMYKSAIKNGVKLSFNEFAVIYSELSKCKNCMICGGLAAVGKKTLDLDHNHKSGAIRGMLCNHCNRGLGSFKDSPDLLRKAADYLENAQS